VNRSTTVGAERSDDDFMARNLIREPDASTLALLLAACTEEEDDHHGEEGTPSR
jgi:hypothetical protein